MPQRVGRAGRPVAGCFVVHTEPQGAQPTQAPQHPRTSCGLCQQSSTLGAAFTTWVTPHAASWAHWAAAWPEAMNRPGNTWFSCSQHTAWRSPVALPSHCRAPCSSARGSGQDCHARGAAEQRCRPPPFDTRGPLHAGHSPGCWLSHGSGNVSIWTRQGELTNHTAPSRTKSHSVDVAGGAQFGKRTANVAIAFSVRRGVLPLHKAVPASGITRAPGAPRCHCRAMPPVAAGRR